MEVSRESKSKQTTADTCTLPEYVQQCAEVNGCSSRNCNNVEQTKTPGEGLVQNGGTGLGNLEKDTEAGLENESYNFNSLLSRTAISQRLSMYVIALRPWSFTTSLCPVGLGTSLYYSKYEAFNIWIFLTTCVCALSVHAAGNLVNTYFDYVTGVDSKKSDDRTLVDQILQPSDVVTMGAVSYCIGCVCFVILTSISPAPMEHIALLYFGGLSASFLYTGGLGLKYIALGDIAIFLTFGPLTVLFAYTAQGGELSVYPLLYAIPLALNTEAILHTNNTRDMQTDKDSGIVTLAILLGKTGSYALFALLLFSPYFMFMYLFATLSPWFILPISTVFLAFNNEKKFRKGFLEGLTVSMAKLNLCVGVSYIVACLLCGPAL